MSRIVIDARELRTSSGRYVERLLHYLQQLDHEHDYRVLLKPGDMSGWQPRNQGFVAVPCPHKEFTFAEQLGLKQQVRNLRAEVVHFTFPQQPVWYRGRTITTIHDLTTLRFTNPDKSPLIFKLKQHVYAYVIKRAVHKAARVLVPSQFVKDDLVAFAQLDPAKVSVTYEAADPITAPPEGLPQLLDKQFIMYVGRPTPHKNLERLLKAFAQLQGSHPHLRLVLAGKLDANYRRIQAQVEQQSLKHVVFTDFVTEGQLRWLYENCAAYVFPSLSEGFGLPGLEAMQHGAPVVSSNATCLPEIYGDAAHYFDPTDSAAMAEAIDEVLTSEVLRKRLTVNGKRCVAQYSWQRMAEQTLQAYKAAL